MRLLYLTERLAISDDMIKKIERRGNYWYIIDKDGHSMDIWDEERKEINDLFNPPKVNQR